LAIPTSQNDAFSHAVARVVTPLIAGLIGAWIDNRVGTGWVFTAVFVALAIVGAFASAYYHYEARMAAHDEGKPWTRRAAR
jgi:uncharacterized membrane protein YeaQ/YmgE (transglycosylase-associated protein family)